MEISAKDILPLLQNRYPEAACELKYSSPFELLVAVILSAQCTDKRVNIVTENLFRTANTPQAFLKMGQAGLEKQIFSCGFYRQKAKNILSVSACLLERFGGAVPDDPKILMTFPGVGRKTANVVAAEAFGKSVIAVDTHVFRVARRLGLSKGKTADAVCDDLTRFFPSETLSKAHHLLIFHGRYCCHSQKPDCKNCPVTEFCRHVYR